MQKTFQRLNKNKRLGASDIPAWALEDCLNILAEPLCFKSNAFFEECKYQKHLKQAHVIPSYKKGDNEDLDTNHIYPCKNLEKILGEQLNEYLERNKLLGPFHFGFPAKYSKPDALLHATEYIRKDLSDNRSTPAAFLRPIKSF